MNVLASTAIVGAAKQLDDNTVRPGLIGLLFFVALFVATYFLWRSMNKQLKKVDEHFEESDSSLRPTTAQEQIAIDQADLTRLGRPSAPDAETDGPGTS